MKSNFQQLFKRFWLLGVLSLLSVFIAYYGILRLLFPAFVSFAHDKGIECNLNLLEGYVSVLTLAILIGGIVFAAREYLRQESQLSFQIYESIHAKLTDPAEEAARRWIIINIEPLEKEDSIEEWIKDFSGKMQKRPNDWKEELPPGHQYVKTALNALDYFGFVAENYVSVEGPLLEWMSPPIAKVWERISPYVERERETRKEPDFYISASYIGEKCLDWRTKMGFKSEIIKSGI